MSDSNKFKALSRGLPALFLLALFMGAGPGVYLINDGGTCFGMPTIYAWGLLWYGVEAICVVLAFLYLWREPEEL